uniref:Uncharacterized protein n=1 Tax=Arundo donax TaxID=35708 RepID=A0A0A9FB76_ARUDO
MQPHVLDYGKGLDPTPPSPNRPPPNRPPPNRSFICRLESGGAPMEADSGNSCVESRDPAMHYKAPCVQQAPRRRLRASVGGPGKERRD